MRSSAQFFWVLFTMKDYIGESSKHMLQRYEGRNLYPAYSRECAPRTAICS